MTGSPRQMARMAGGLYLINIVAGAFAIGLVPALLVVHDMAATAHNIQAHELLYRLSMAAHIVVTLTNIPMALLFYDLLESGQPEACAAGRVLHPGRDRRRGRR